MKFWFIYFLVLSLGKEVSIFNVNNFFNFFESFFLFLIGIIMLFSINYRKKNDR